MPFHLQSCYFRRFLEVSWTVGSVFLRTSHVWICHRSHRYIEKSSQNDRERQCLDKIWSRFIPSRVICCRAEKTFSQKKMIWIFLGTRYCIFSPSSMLCESSYLYPFSLFIHYFELITTRRGVRGIAYYICWWTGRLFSRCSNVASSSKSRSNKQLVVLLVL